MRIIVKKNLIVFRIPSDWEEISARLVKEYGPSIGISWKCKRELGFTVRHHKGLAKWDDSPYNDGQDGYLIAHEMPSELANQYHYEQQVHLDFYNEAQQSFFVLKYLNK